MHRSAERRARRQRSTEQLTSKWAAVLAFLFAGMGLVAVTTFWIDAPSSAAARAHPTVDGLLQSGSVESTHARTWWLSWLFGALMLSAVATLVIRAPLRRGFGKGAWGVVLAALVLQAAFAGLVLSHHHALGDPDVEPWGPFPPATTWMLLILYPSQLLFVVGFVVGFRTWMWTEEDETSFERLLQDQRSD